jgi:hypothetical protein
MAAGPVNGRSMTSIREIANAVMNARLAVISACDANLRTPKSTWSQRGYRAPKQSDPHYWRQRDAARQQAW